jgi:hypothetical protein
MWDNPWFPTRASTVSSDFYQSQRQQSDLMFLRKNSIVQLKLLQAQPQIQKRFDCLASGSNLGDFLTVWVWIWITFFQDIQY